MPSTKPSTAAQPRAAARKAGTTRAAAGKLSKTLATTATKTSSADRTRAETLLAEIGRRKQRIAEDFFDIGLALAQLSKKKLYVALGHGSFDEMLKARNVLSPTTARALIQVVSTMSREEAIAYGQEKAIALLSYTKATPELDTPQLLMKGGELPGGKRVADASVRDIKAAAKRVREAQGKAKPVSAEARAASAEAKAVASWLRSHGASKPKVTEVRGKDGYALRVELPVAAWAHVRSS